MAIIVFAIDNGQQPLIRNKFRDLLRNLKGCGKLRDFGFKECIGYWEGELEFSYVVDREVFWKHIYRDWCTGQQCFGEIEFLNWGEPFWIIDHTGYRTSLSGYLMDSATEPTVSAWTLVEGRYWFAG